MKQGILSKLVKECTVNSVQCLDYGESVSVSYFDKNKFADMVVNLCPTELKELPCDYRDYRNQIEDYFRRDIIAEIEYKFGVNQ